VEAFFVGAMAGAVPPPPFFAFFRGDAFAGGFFFEPGADDFV
jgi:hypothetical protein